MSGNKFIINQNGEIEDTMAHITFDSFMEILIVLNGQSRHLKKLSEENEQLKQFKNKVFSCIEKAVEETEKYNHSDTSRYYSRKDLLAKLQDGLTGDVE